MHIHYSIEPDRHGSAVTRWLVLDITMPALVRPLRPVVVKAFDRENVRNLAALKAYAETTR